MRRADWGIRPEAKELGFMADSSLVVRTPHTPHRRVVRLLTLLVLVAVFGSACSATPSWIPVESAAGSDTISASDAASIDAAQAPEELAFVDVADEEGTAGETVEPEQPVPSDSFCSTSANIWIHSAALNLIGNAATDEMTRIAMANVAEWIERSTLFDEPAGPDHNDLFAAFSELQVMVGDDFGFDWTDFQSSTVYANSPSAQTYEAARTDLVPFLNNDCASQSMADLRSDAKARADDLTARFSAEPSTVVESDSLPGHSIFTHSSGRLIASFPTAWSYEERTGSAIVELIASPDIDRFLAGEAIDGVHLQLIEAATMDEFRSQIDATAIGSSCLRTNDLASIGTGRQNITQTFACIDHGASIVGQYNDNRGLGLIIEARFDRPEASRADLIRLTSIANSALWS